MPMRLSLVLALLLCASGARAGLLFVPDTPGTAWRVTWSTTRAAIGDTEVALRSSDVVSGAGAFSALIPLPEGVTTGTVELHADGRAVEARLLAPAEAQALLFELGRKSGDTRLASFAGRAVVHAPNLTLGKRTRLETTLRLPVSQTNGLADVRLPLPAASLAAGPMERLTIDLSLAASKPLRVVTSPSHDVEVERTGPRTARVRFSRDAVAETEDLRLLFAADDDPLGLRVLTHRPEGAPHGYFLLLGNPTGTPAAPVPQDLVLVLDTSGSMRGEKHAQAQLAAEYVIDRLGPADRFNVIAFGSEVKSFRPGVVPATPADRAAAKAFVQGLLAVGQTNISGALAAGLGGGAPTDGRPRLMLFLTDGTPTVGELDPEKIAADVAKKRGTQIFALGVGHDVNAHLLDRLARDSGGLSLYVEPDEDLDVRAAALWDGLRHPFLTGVRLVTGGLQADHLLPALPSALFQGQELLAAGRYTGGGRHTLTLRGEQRAFSVTADFPRDPKPDEGFVAWLWASRRIGELLAEIRLRGQSPERVAEVVQLSRDFGIVTEYTAFLASADRDYTNAEAVEEAARLMGTANAQKSGRWAVKQADNESKLRHRKVSSVESNTWEDQQGQVQKASKVRTVDGKAYYQREGRWVESGSKAKQTRRVKKFSAEYFDLVKKDKDFAKAQSLGGDTTLDVGDTRVEVY